MLDWSLTVCTYNRPHFLLPMIGYIEKQTRRPKEIVIVDASDDWQPTQKELLAQYPALWKKTKLIYQPAKVRSLTFQRNQALDLTSGDIVFSLDDDIYLYPDTAEAIMRGYEADSDENIAMIGAHFANYSPDTAPKQKDSENETAKPKKNITARFKEMLENQLSLDHHFVAYANQIDDDPLPDPVAKAGIEPSGLINGGRTTFRRRFGAQERWSELLRYYATHEDSDFSYRLSQHARLTVAPEALLFHADGNERRLNRFKVNTIRVRNLMALHRSNSKNCIRSTFRLMRSFLFFAGLYLLIDAAQKRLSFPVVRAYLLGAIQTPYFMFAPRSDFKAWYHALQEKMYQT